MDELIDRYVGWREESIAVQESYRVWQDSTADAGRLAYAAYLAALDREEHAANCYRDIAEKVSGSGPALPGDLIRAGLGS